MCYVEKPGHRLAHLHGIVTRMGVNEMCGCMVRHGTPHYGRHGMCCCHERMFFGRKERKEMLEKYRESLKKELDGVEEELKVLQTDS